MARLVKDRIKQTTTTTGANNLALSGSVAGYQNFSVLGDGNTTFYCIEDANGTAFEVGIGTYTSNTLARTTILDSTNSGNAISLTSGTHDVFVTYPAGRAGFNDEGLSPTLTASGTVTAGKPVIQNTNGTVTQVGTTTIAAGLGTLSSTTVTNAEDNTVAMGETNQFVNVYRIANATNIYLTPNTISSTDLKTITKGTTVSFDAGYERICGIIYEPNQGKYVAISMDSNNYVTGTAVTFNGTGSSATLTLGTRTVLDSSAYGGTVANSQIAYDTTAQKIVLSYYAGNPFTLVVNLSGTTLTSGSRTAVPIAASYINSSSMKCAYSSTENRIIYLYATNEYGQPNDKKLYTTVGTVSGTSISFGATAIVSNQPTPYQNNAKDAEVGVDNNGVVVLSYLSSGLVLQSQAGTLSNTTITWGSPSQVSNITCLEANNTLGESSIRPISNGKMIVTRATKSDSPSNASQGIFCIITVSGTTVNNGSVQTFSSSATDFPNASTNTSQTQAVINFGYGSFNNIIFQESSQAGPSNLTPTNYLGIASNSATTTNPVQINVPGSINNAQTSLVVDKDYYVTDTGLIKERTTTTVTPDTNPTATTPVVETGSSVANERISISYEATSGYYLRSRRDLNTNYPVAESGTYSSSTKEITWSTAVVIKSESLRGNCVYNTTGGGYGHIAFTTRQSSNENPTVKLVTVSGGTLTIKGEEIVEQITSSGNSIQPVGISYDTSQDTIIAVFHRSSSNQTIKAYPMVVNGSANGYTYSSSNIATINDQSVSGIQTGSGRRHAVRFDPDTNRTIIIYTNENSTYLTYARVVSASGVSLTVGSQQASTLPNRGELANCYDTQNNKLIIVGNADQSGNDVKYIIATVTGGGTNTISFTSPAFLFSDTSTVSEYFGLEYDADVNQSYFVYYKGSNNTGLLMFSSDGSTITRNSDTTIYSTSYPKEFGNYSMVYAANKGVSASIGYDNTSMVNFNITLGSTSSTVVNGSVFAGTALSATALELKTFPASTIVGKASNSITKGKPVIVEADGDFAPVQIAGEAGGLQTATALPNQASSTPFKARVAHNWDDNETVAMYNNSNSSNYPVAVKVIIDGSYAITYGTPTVINSSTSPNNNKVIYHPPSGNYAFLYNNSSQNTYAKVGALAANGSWTFGTHVIATGYTCYEADMMYWEAGNKIVIGYQPASANGTYTLLMTVSGTSTSFSNETRNQNSNTEQDIELIPVNSTYYMLLARNSSNGDYETYMCSVSGSSIAYNKTNNVIANASNESSMEPRGAMINTDKVGVVYLSSASTAGQMHGVVGTVSGNTVTWGSEIDILLGQNIRQSGPGRLTFTSAANQGSSSKKEFMYTSTINHPSYKPVWIKINASNDTLALDSYEIYDTLGYQQSGAGDGGASNAFNNNTNSYIISTTYNTSSQNGVNASSVQVLRNSTIASNLTAENYIGIAQETVSTNEDVKVTTISGVDANQSSLTPAQTYYVQTDGTLSTTAGSPSVVAGTAIASTQLLVSRS